MENIAKRRDLSIKKGKRSLGGVLGSWEMILIYIFVLINVILMVTKSDLFFTAGTVQAIIQSSLDYSFMVLGMILILMLGDIDVSIASIMILSAMVLGMVYQAFHNTLLAMLACFAVSIVCGLFNGFLVSFIRMPAVIVTIASSMLYRGIAQIALGVNSLKEFPSWYSTLSWQNVGPVPIILICFIVATIIFGLLLHKTSFGRKLYIVGNNPESAEYSGIQVKKVKLQVFGIMGLMCGVSAIFFIGRYGGVSSTMATGYELDVIAICVLGGISPSGGKGRIFGPFIAALVMEFLFYALGLFGVEANTRKIITGVVLIVAVIIPMINKDLFHRVNMRVVYKNNKKVESLKFRLEEDLKKCDSKIEVLEGDNALSVQDKKQKIEEIKNKKRELKKKCKIDIKNVMELKKA